MMKNFNEVSMMEKYGITCKQKNIYHFKNHQYSKLQDAINYAKFDDNNPDIEIAAEVKHRI